MADGVWSDKKDKVFVSTVLLAMALDSWLSGIGLADNGNESIHSPDYS